MRLDGKVKKAFLDFMGPEGSHVGPIWPNTVGRNVPKEIRAEWREMKPWCLQMSARHSLVLLPVKDDGSGHFQRAGIAIIEKKWLV